MPILAKNLFPIIKIHGVSIHGAFELDVDDGVWMVPVYQLGIICGGLYD